MLINPRETVVRGYERPACLEMLISLMTGIVEGDNIPPVEMYTFDNGKTFQIPYVGKKKTNTDAGHHRTLAAYLLGEDLSIDVVEKAHVATMRMQIPDIISIAIGNIRIEQNPEKFMFESQTMKKHYRPLPSPEEFFGRYRKINLALRFGTHRDYSLNERTYQAMLDRVEKARSEASR